MQPHEIIASQSTPEEGAHFKRAFDHLLQPAKREAEPRFIFAIARSDATKPEGILGVVVSQTKAQVLTTIGQPAAEGYATMPEDLLRHNLTRFVEAYFGAAEGYYKKQNHVASIAAMGHLSARNSEGIPEPDGERDRVMLAYFIPASAMRDGSNTVYFAIGTRKTFAPN